ncbi:MAG: ATP synthase F1 subunit gamma [Acidobacteria bacterium 13_1_20CM_3_58_11]|nr:MAG: ATP synthase F1 subunit gamma [Acidobacteria bacterium 13_1_20CM_58_21]OLE47515.1 MAG: ATP synthase F1 subunit gamma [Acidobacteria bacterium 13_1_20CM_3_58_11]
MATLLDFRRRIRSVKNTQQITRAMKFVAAARLRRAQEAALAARPYARELARMLRSIMSRIDEPQHPLLADRPEQRILAIVLAGERGLAGAFNANILRKAQDFFRARKGKKLSAIPIGKKGRDALKKAGFHLIAEYVNVLARVDFLTAREIAVLVTDLYAKEEIDSVYMVFSEFKTVMTPNLVVTKLLPVEAVPADEESAAGSATSEVDYIYEQPEQQLLGKLLPRYIETQLLRAMLESSAAEHAARMTAMESATKNAGDVMEALTLHMNKVRQAAITKEIIEIVSGASYGA